MAIDKLLRNMPDKTLTSLILTAVGSLVAPIFFGGFGGGARYLHTVVLKKSPFYFGDFIVHIVLGIFVGLLVHFAMYETLKISLSGVILISGLLSVEIISMIESSGVPEIVRRILGQK